MCESVQEQQVAFLLVETPDAQKRARVWVDRCCRLNEAFADTAADDMYLGPRAEWNPTLDLGRAEVADCCHERGSLDLFGQAQPNGRIELARAVNGDAVARPAEPPHQERHSRGVRTEVHVYVLDPLAPHDAEQVRGLHEVRQVPDQTAV